MGLKLNKTPFYPTPGFARTLWGSSPTEMPLHGTGLILGFCTPGKKRTPPKAIRNWKKGAGGVMYGQF